MKPMDDMHSKEVLNSKRRLHSTCRFDSLLRGRATRRAIAFVDVLASGPCWVSTGEQYDSQLCFYLMIELTLISITHAWNKPKFSDPKEGSKSSLAEENHFSWIPSCSVREKHWETVAATIEYPFQIICTSGMLPEQPQEAKNIYLASTTTAISIHITSNEQIVASFVLLPTAPVSAWTNPVATYSTVRNDSCHRLVFGTTS